MKNETLFDPRSEGVLGLSYTDEYFRGTGGSKY